MQPCARLAALALPQACIIIICSHCQLVSWAPKPKGSKVPKQTREYPPLRKTVPPAPHAPPHLHRRLQT